MTTKAMNAPLQKGKSRLNRNNGWDYLMIGFLVLFALICVYPFWYVVIGSFSDGADYMRGGVYLWPREWSLQNYQVTLVDSRLWIGFRVTIARTFICTITHVLFTAMVAYAMSRSDLPCRKFIYWFNMFTMFFGGGLIPTYLVIQRLQMLNTIWALILPGCLSVYNMIVARTFFKSNISEELYEAAEIDGCTQARFFFQIALPLSKAIIAILVLYYGVGHWNSYFSALVYISDKAKYPLQLVLRNILITNQTALSQTATTAAARAALQEKQQLIDVMKYSLIIISSIPVLVMYPLVQKHFVKGVMIGSMKG